jgi:hypothetical protein
VTTVFIKPLKELFCEEGVSAWHKPILSNC